MIHVAFWIVTQRILFRSLVNESKFCNELIASQETLFQICELFFLHEILGKVLQKRDKF